MAKEKPLSEKVVIQHLKAFMKTTKKWGRIPMIEENNSGGLFAESSRPILNVDDVALAVKRLKEEFKFNINKQTKGWELATGAHLQMINEIFGDFK